MTFDHSPRLWLPDEDALLRTMIVGKTLYERQENFPRLAKALNRTEGACRNRATQQGLVLTYKHVPQSKWHQSLDLAAEETGVEVTAILRGNQSRNVCKARWIAFAILRFQGYSLPSIGHVFGYHHTTVLAGLRRLKEIDGGEMKW